jgi:hypothetical protein
LLVVCCGLFWLVCCYRVVLRCSAFSVPETAVMWTAAGLLLIFVIVARAALTFWRVVWAVRMTASLFSSLKLMRVRLVWLAPDSPNIFETVVQIVSRNSFGLTGSVDSMASARYLRLIRFSSLSPVVRRGFLGLRIWGRVWRGFF